MRKKHDGQSVLEFDAPSLKLTVRHYARYEAIHDILLANPQILQPVHVDLEMALQVRNPERKRQCEFTADNVLRILICKTIEAETFRGISVRIDDSSFFRKFVRIYDRPMMEFTTLNKLANCIQPATWEKVNAALGRHAVAQELIKGDKLRIDTTAVETNIHWPTDSGLLWDTYRVLARLIDRARELDPAVVGDKRLQVRAAKKLHTLIQRQGSAKAATGEKLKGPYTGFLRLVDGILALAKEVAQGLAAARKSYVLEAVAISDLLVERLEHYRGLGARVADQARRRVLGGESVPNSDKVFSIFEPHTELLKRGRAGKPIEFGHMISIQQVEGTFITGYRVFDKKPNEHQLIDPAVASHTKLFGKPPSVLTADKGFYESMDRIAAVEQDVDLVAIGKKGNRTPEERERETDVLFKLAQRFRAGIEGSISFLKRCMRLGRCFNQGIVHYTATIGVTVFAHNLLVLARDS